MKTADLITVLDLARIELESAYKKLGYSDSNVLKSVNESIVNLQSSQFKPEGKTLSEEDIREIVCPNFENKMQRDIHITNSDYFRGKVDGAKQICSLTPNSNEYKQRYEFLLEQTNRLINEISELKANSKGGEAWISVEKRLPENECPVLVYQPNEHTQLEVFVCGFKNGNFLPFEENDVEGNGKYEPLSWFDEITHWMPLPEAPKQSNK